MIRNNLRLLLIVPGLWAPAGCESMNKTEQGAVGGGVLGGTAGALIGSTTGHTGAGAAIGAGLGAVSGGLIGNSIEESEHKAKAVATAVPAPGQLSLSDIAQMAQQQLSDGVIISQIRTTLEIDVPLKLLFEAPSVAQLAPHLRGAHKPRIPLVRRYIARRIAARAE